MVIQKRLISRGESLEERDSLDGEQSSVLRTMDLYNGMILSTLSISFYDFAFGFSKRPRTNEDVFFTYKLMIILLNSRGGTPAQQSSTIPPQTKYTLEPPLSLMEPSNNLPIIEARFLSIPFSRAFEQSIHFVQHFNHFLTTSLRLINFLFRHLRILLT